jgi:hypothetical protein
MLPLFGKGLKFRLVWVNQARIFGLINRLSTAQVQFTFAFHCVSHLYSFMHWFELGKPLIESLPDGNMMVLLAPPDKRRFFMNT